MCSTIFQGERLGVFSQKQITAFEKALECPSQFSIVKLLLYF